MQKLIKWIKTVLKNLKSMTQPYAVCMLNIKTQWLKEKGGKIYTADKNYKKGGV